MRVYLTDYRTAWSDVVKRIEDIKYPQSVHLFEDCFKKLSTGLSYVPHKVAEKVMDPVLCKSLRASSVKTAFILASGNSHFAGISPRFYDNSLSYTYKFLPLTLSQVYAGRIGQALGATDYITTDATACASSLKVMMDVLHLIKLYDFDRVIVLSVEDSVSNSTLEFFGEARANITPQQEDSGILPSAFDKTNQGFRVAQGAVLAVFESETIATNPKAELLGAYTASEECSNAIGQREDGQGFTRAILGSMRMAKLLTQDIHVIKTHGTGTASNNVSEKNGITKVFDRFMATSLKPKIGHTMGASGLLETCLLMDDMSQGFISPILNRTEKDSVFISEPVETQGGNILSLAAGMGNVYSSAIFNTRV